MRSAPSASFTTLRRSAPKKITSPACAPVREMIVPSTSGERNFTIGDCRPVSSSFAGSFTRM
jgi:hypothetical protein